MQVESKDEKGVTHLIGKITVDGVEVPITGKEYDTSEGQQNKFFMATDDYYKIQAANGVSRQVLDTAKDVDGRIAVATATLFADDIVARPSLTKRELRIGNTGLKVTMRPFHTDPPGNFDKDAPKERVPVYGRVMLNKSFDLPADLVKGAEFQNSLASKVKAVVEKLPKPECKTEAKVKAA